MHAAPGPQRQAGFFQSLWNRPYFFLPGVSTSVWNVLLSIPPLFQKPAPQSYFSLASLFLILFFYLKNVFSLNISCPGRCCPAVLSNRGFRTGPSLSLTAQRSVPLAVISFYVLCGDVYFSILPPSPLNRFPELRVVFVSDIRFSWSLVTFSHHQALLGSW